MWLKYALMQYYYNPNVHLPELNSIALYTPRVVEVVKERPHWNATDFFSPVHPNTPYLHQLPCSWGALFMPARWREFYKYMGMRFTEDAKSNPVQIPKSRTNGWQVGHHGIVSKLSLSVTLFFTRCEEYTSACLNIFTLVSLKMSSTNMMICGTGVMEEVSD